MGRYHGVMIAGRRANSKGDVAALRRRRVGAATGGWLLPRRPIAADVRSRVRTAVRPYSEHTALSAHPPDQLRVDSGGHPQTPGKEGYALSALSWSRCRRTRRWP